MFTTLQVNSYINGGILYIQLYYAAFNYEIAFSKVSHFLVEQFARCIPKNPPHVFTKTTPFRYVHFRH